MLFRPMVLITLLAIAPLTASAQSADTPNACDPSTTTCPDLTTTGVNVDP